jgi:hypothetical protein
MQLPDTEFTERPWRIHEVAPDFRLEDVWALPGSGGTGDFPELVELISSSDPSEWSSPATRALWALRWKLGELFGWDDPESGVGARVASLRDRLPEDLRAAPRPEFGPLPFSSLYLTEDEFAAELANKTVHGVLHVGAVPDGPGRFRAQLAVLVKPNGRQGRAYLAAIRPFRHLIVYPAMMREGERRWTALTNPAAGAAV